MNWYGAGPWDGDGSEAPPVDVLSVELAGMGLCRWTRTFVRLMTSSDETNPRDSSEFRLDNQQPI